MAGYGKKVKKKKKGTKASKGKAKQASYQAEGQSATQARADLDWNEVWGGKGGIVGTSPQSTTATRARTTRVPVRPKGRP